MEISAPLFLNLSDFYRKKIYLEPTIKGIYRTEGILIPEIYSEYLNCKVVVVFIKNSFLIFLGFLALSIGMMTSIFYHHSFSQLLSFPFWNYQLRFTHFFCNEGDAKYPFKLFYHLLSLLSVSFFLFLLISWSPKISSILIFLTIDFRNLFLYLLLCP